MKATRNIVSYFLLALYGLVLLHNFVPHTHLESDFTAPHQHEHDYSHTHGHAHHHHGDEDQQPAASLFDFLLLIIEGHNIQFNTDDGHFSAYQSGKKLSIVDVATAYVLPPHDFSWYHPPPPEVKSDFFQYDFSLKEDEKFSCSPLRAPPVSG